MCRSFFFFNDTATTEIYTLSLHDALPISCGWCDQHDRDPAALAGAGLVVLSHAGKQRDRRRGLYRACVQRRFSYGRSEEHTSELQSRQYLVCRLLLEKKKHNSIKLLLVLY